MEDGKISFPTVIGVVFVRNTHEIKLVQSHSRYIAHWVYILPFVEKLLRCIGICGKENKVFGNVS